VSTAGSSFDTLLGVFTYTGTGFGTLLAANDDCINDRHSCLTGVPVSPGTELRFQVWHVAT
jgi:hypothetical protein